MAKDCPAFLTPKLNGARALGANGRFNRYISEHPSKDYVYPDDARAWQREMARFWSLRAGFRAEALFGRWPQPNQAPDLLVNRDAGRVIVLVPKVASQAVLRAARDLDPDGTTIEHLGHGESIAAVRDLGSFEWVAVVREPLARVQSCYQNKVAVLDTTGSRARRLARHFGLRPGMGLPAFCAWLALSPYGSDARADRHWVSQVSMIERLRPLAAVHVVPLVGAARLDPAKLLIGSELRTAVTLAPDPPMDYSTASLLDEMSVRLLSERYLRDAEAVARAT